MFYKMLFLKDTFPLQENGEHGPFLRGHPLNHFVWEHHGPSRQVIKLMQHLHLDKHF